MGMGGIRTDHHDAGGITQILDIVGHCTGTEGGGQTGHRWGMSNSCAVVHIIRPQHCPGKLLCHIIIFITRT